VIRVVVDVESGGGETPVVWWCAGCARLVRQQARSEAGSKGDDTSKRLHCWRRDQTTPGERCCAEGKARIIPSGKAHHQSAVTSTPRRCKLANVHHSYTHQTYRQVSPVSLARRLLLTPNQTKRSQAKPSKQAKQAKARVTAAGWHKAMILRPATLHFVFYF
jgi:hypothetical protein